MPLNNKFSATQRAGSQRGSAIIYVLLGIALFAAVMFAVSRSNNSGSVGIMGKGNAKTQATSILNYATTIATEVGKLQSKGCSENQIGLNNPNMTEENVNTSTDCQVFSSAGGKVTYKSNDSLGAQAHKFTGRCGVSGVGSSTHLVFMLNGMSRETCIEINKLLGIPAVDGEPPQLTYVCSNSAWNGNFAKNGTIDGPSGKDSACVKGMAGSYSIGTFLRDRYGFYKVILKR